MQPVTLVATDLDGTLLNSRKNVTKRTRDAIRELKKHGILFGVASGRPVESGVLLAKDWGLEDSISFFIGMNGGVILDTRTGQKDQYHLLDGEEVQNIIDFFSDMDVIFQVMDGNHRWVNKSTPETRAHARLYGEIEEETDLREYLKGRQVNKLIIWSDPAYQPQVKARAMEYKSDKVHHCATADNLYEFMDPAINKGFGIDRISDHFGVNRENIIAFGDQENDIQMLTHAGTGVAMQNGSDSAKEAADFISRYTNDEDALARFIEDVILPNSKAYVLPDELVHKKSL